MAIDHPPSRHALRRYGRRGPAYLVIAAAALAGGFGLVAIDAPDRIATYAFSGSAAAVVLGVWMILRWMWMGRVLRSSPWVPRRGRYHVVSPRFEINHPRNLYAVLILDADEHGPEVLCSVPELRWRLRTLAEPGGPVEVWVAGDPQRKAVATRDGQDIVPIRQPRLSLWRNRLRRRVEGQIEKAAEKGATRRS